MINQSDPRLAKAILAEYYQTADRERQIAQMKRGLVNGGYKITWQKQVRRWLGRRLTTWGCYLQVQYQGCEKAQCATGNCSA